jgi:hypothetical protein
MRRAITTCALVAVTAGAALTQAAPAAASPGQESIFMDDSELALGRDDQAEATMAVLHDLGVDRVRVSVIWRLIAPDPDSHTRPAFGAGGAADPAAYSSSAWNRYDRVVAAARRYGMGVLFTLTGPAPLWASSEPSRGEPMWDPNPNDFRDFVTAVGRRYSGSYTDEQPQQPPEPGGLPLLPPQDSPPPQPAPAVVPGVDHWSAWNEPNQPGWLRPQTRARLPASPRLYRALQDAAYEGLRQSGHGGDTYLLGETAPRGGSQATEVTPMRPLVFIRELYCVNRRLRPFTGRSASARGCPTDRAGRQRFASDHPGLFKATGWAHHPYALEVAPDVKDRAHDQVTISVLGRLTRTLDRVFRRYGQNRRLPIWLTEYGYQTNPPDPIVGVSWARQAAYLNRAEQIAYRNPRVQSVAQFLLVDDAPNTKVSPRDPRYWGSTFQSGLVTGDGHRKPAFAAYQRTLDVTRERRGRLRLFGQLRPAAANAKLTAAIQFRRSGARDYATVRTVTISNLRNYLVAHVKTPRRSGWWRLLWQGSEPSREVFVRRRPAKG